MSDRTLVENVAKAQLRQQQARETLNAAESEDRDASRELMGAWTDLRQHQDEQVKEALRAMNP